MGLSKINIKIVHIVSWLSYLIIFTVFLSDRSGLKFAFYRASQMVLIQAVLFYLNSLVLMPRLLEKRKYVFYFSSLAILVILAVGVLYTLNFHIKPFGEILPKGLGKRMEPQYSITFSRGIMRYFSSIMAIVLLSIVYRMFSHKISKEKQEAALHNENLLSEMKFLKSQVNPHFLFNSLNNIYTLVLLKHDKAPTMLMKLSEMLRYMLYECNDELVPLEKEIIYINNYIGLQQLKTEQPQIISTDFDVPDHTILIPPLLLIPFVENSFKHSKIEDIKTGWVKISLVFSKGQVIFQISNSIPSISVAKDKTRGIGLENVGRRLELLYHDKHELKINETQKVFSVMLRINTDR